MSKQVRKYDAVIIGGGIFGLYSSQILSLGGLKVAIVEKEKEIFERASKINQARVHRGYHYPRSLDTARKTASYFDRFCSDFSFAILKPFKQYYAISKEHSKISLNEYIRFCEKVGISLKEVSKSLFFQEDKVEAVFEAEEACFDYAKLKEYFLNQSLSNKNITIYCDNFPVFQKISNAKYILTLRDFTLLETSLVVNTTYSNVNKINKMFGFKGYDIKYELCELKICKIHNGFSGIGLTVMDGPFFSLMPFGDGSLYSLSSVNFTPISTSYTKPQKINYMKVRYSDKKAEFLARSYLKNNIDFKYLYSIFEVKPILMSSEEDDSRPTLITVHSQNPYFVSVLAGKISTIYDLEKSLKQLIKNLRANKV